jgi:hypothetical protein
MTLDVGSHRRGASALTRPLRITHPSTLHIPLIVMIAALIAAVGLAWRNYNLSRSTGIALLAAIRPTSSQRWSFDNGLQMTAAPAPEPVDVLRTTKETTVEFPGLLPFRNREPAVVPR